MSFKGIRLFRDLSSQNRYAALVYSRSCIITRNFSKTQNGHNQDDRKSWVSVLLTGATLSAGFGWYILRKHPIKAENADNKKNNKLAVGEAKPDLPTYRAEDVLKHDTTDNFWITYKSGVYDITKFLPSHPGGKQIYNAAGHAIDPFWEVYKQHHTNEIYELLESYRIGNLHSDDVCEEEEEDNLWSNEPKNRSKSLNVLSQEPFCAEAPQRNLCNSFYTPNHLFYVRSHMPIPDIDKSEFKLTIEGIRKPVNLSLNDLKKYTEVTIDSSLMCAGNRRSEMAQIKSVKGLPWKCGAISHASWTGVYLRDVLLDAGVTEKNMYDKHVIFTGSDIDAVGHNFNVSIPLSTALDPKSKVLLATKMNGEDIPRDHGYPLRVIVPGVVAVRNVKWLQSITISDIESQSHYQQGDYKLFNSSTTWENADFSKSPAIQNLPITSAICTPQNGDKLPVKIGFIEAKGYAYSGGGAKITRVDISSDKGVTWETCNLESEDKSQAGQHYSWCLWNARIPVVPGQQSVNIWVKAIDSNNNSQPENFDHLWNLRGLLGNAYHKIKVDLQW